MSTELQKRLRQLRTAEMQTAPDRAWVQATRGTLLMQVRNTLPTSRKLSWAKRLREVVRYALPESFLGWISRPAMAALTLVVVLTGGSIMSVSAAEQSMPGDFLYGLKLATEQARLALTATKGEKLKLKTEFTARRIQELKQVVATDKKSEKVVQVTEILKRDMNTLKEQLADVAKEEPAAQATEAAKLVDQKSNEVISALQETKNEQSPQTKEKMTEAQSVAADAGVKALEVLVEKHQESKDLVPAEEVAQAIQDHAKVVAGATVLSAPLDLASTLAPTSVIMSASSTLSDLQTTSTASTTSESLPAMVDQAKSATAQAFALQKAQDQLEVAGVLNASGTGMLMTETASGTAPTTGEAAAVSSTGTAEPTSPSQPKETSQ